MPQETPEQEKTGLEVRVSKLESSPVPERGKFVAVFGATPKEEYPPERGRLFAAVDLKIDPSEDASMAARLVWDTLSEEYYAPEEETPVAALERAVYAVRDKLRTLSPAAVMELGAIAFRGEVAYLAKMGRPAIYLRRGTETQELFPGEEGVSVSSQILEEGDTVVLGSPVFAKNFPPADLPRTEFLEKQFSSGEKIPGFAALLLTLASSREAREEAAAKSRSSRDLLGKLSAVGAGIGRQAKELIASVRSPQGFQKIKAKIAAAWKKRISHGEELAEEKQVISQEPVASSEETEAEEPAGETKAPKKGFKLPKLPAIKGLSLPRLILILVVILGVSVAFTTWQQAKKARAAELDRLLTEATQNLDEATGLVGLSNERARELVDEARADLDRALDLTKDTSAIDSLLAQANTLFNAIEKITLVGEDNLVYDLSLQVTGAQGLALSGTGSATVYALEGTRGAVFKLDLSKELPTASALGEGKIGGALEFIAEGEYLYIRGAEAVYRIRISSGAVDEPISFDQIDKTIAIDTYLGNIYLLDSGSEQIYKFWNLPGGYAKAQNWVKGAVPMEGIIDMAIDGEIWLLGSTGEIVRLSAGESVPFEIVNLPSPMTNPIKIFTQPKMDNLYILDRGGNRLVVLEKSGNFVGQFKGDFLANAADLWVSANEKSLFILANSKIYRIDQ
ncbi:MAG: hypothetical protein WDZ67_01965 [Patescibacteria group bacterium]